MGLGNNIPRASVILGRIYTCRTSSKLHAMAGSWSLILSAVSKREPQKMHHSALSHLVLALMETYGFDAIRVPIEGRVMNPIFPLLNDSPLAKSIHLVQRIGQHVLAINSPIEDSLNLLKHIHNR